MDHFMRSFLFAAGIVLIVIGAIWLLQGVNVLPGSFMTGQAKWAVIGGICLGVGLVLTVLSRWL